METGTNTNANTSTNDVPTDQDQDGVVVTATPTIPTQLGRKVYKEVRHAEIVEMYKQGIRIVDICIETDAKPAYIYWVLGKYGITNDRGRGSSSAEAKGKTNILTEPNVKALVVDMYKRQGMTTKTIGTLLGASIADVRRALHEANVITPKGRGHLARYKAIMPLIMEDLRSAITGGEAYNEICLKYNITLEVLAEIAAKYTGLGGILNTLSAKDFAVQIIDVVKKKIADTTVAAVDVATDTPVSIP